MTTTIGDGLAIIEQTPPGSVDLLVLDVDQKDPGLALRCPPESFVAESALAAAMAALSECGIMGKCFSDF